MVGVVVGGAVRLIREHFKPWKRCFMGMYYSDTCGCSVIKVGLRLERSLRNRIKSIGLWLNIHYLQAKVCHEAMGSIFSLCIFSIPYTLSSHLYAIHLHSAQQKNHSLKTKRLVQLAPFLHQSDLYHIFCAELDSLIQKDIFNPWCELNPAHRRIRLPYEAQLVCRITLAIFLLLLPSK